MTELEKEEACLPINSHFAWLGGCSILREDQSGTAHPGQKRGSSAEVLDRIERLAQLIRSLDAATEEAPDA